MGIPTTLEALPAERLGFSFPVPSQSQRKNAGPLDSPGRSRRSMSGCLNHVVSRSKDKHLRRPSILSERSNLTKLGTVWTDADSMVVYINEQLVGDGRGRNGRRLRRKCAVQNVPWFTVGVGNVWHQLPEPTQRWV